MRDRATVVTGLGILSAIGHNVDEVWRALVAGRSGLGPLTLFPSSRYGHVPVAEVRGDLSALGAPARGSRSDRLAVLAARQAVQMAGFDEAASPLPSAAGVVLGASTGGSIDSERFLEILMRERRMWTRPVRYTECASSADFCAEHFDLRGPCATLSTACSSSALALAMGCDLIAAGDADIVLAGGVDTLCRLTLNGFGSLLLIAPDGCRPFDRNRKGMTLGEGAAVLVLEEEGAARARGAPILARVAGWGATCDAHHATAPDPEGQGALRAMRQALACAGLEPDAIDYVNAHGTGTRDNDIAESHALRALFGRHIPALSSTKRFFGHTLAAAGAVEAVVCIKALAEGMLPANIGLDEPDPALGVAPLTAPLRRQPKHILSNSFGFGGNNAALVFSRVTASCPGASHRKGAKKEVASIGVYGVGIASPAGMTTDALFARTRNGGVQPEPCILEAPLPSGTVPVYRCGALAARDELSAGQRRRLSRLQQMAVVCAKQSVRAAEGVASLAERMCVAVGTGFGCLIDAAAFYENMFEHDEQAPMPMAFINSVHNAAAGQAAMALAAKGLNTAPTHHDISFEAALWQGYRQLATGLAASAVVGAIDEISPYVLGIGRHWGWWDQGAPPVEPLGCNLPRGGRPLCGEGCAIFTLAPVQPGRQPLARVTAVRFGRYGSGRTPGIDAAAETRWIEDALTAEGMRLGEIDLVLTGANGWQPHDARYGAVLAALRARSGRACPQGVYKQWCGEHYSASAFGFAVALGLLQEKISVQDVVAEGEPDAPCRTVLLYTLSPSGVKGLCCLRL